MRSAVLNSDTELAPGPVSGTELVNVEDDASSTSAIFRDASAMGEIQQARTPNPQPRTPSPESRTVLRRRPSSAARVAASRANGRKSIGPRTPEGKRRSSQNARRPNSTRLRGEFEARALGQEAGAAEQLYRELVAPFERPGRPVSPMLAMHFHDLARLRLELEAWERIRDAQLEEKWRQGQIELRRRLHNLQADLPASTAEVFEKGLCRLDPSPARAKQQAQCLHALLDHLERRDFDILPMLEKLYGQDLRPASDRAETICLRAERLMHPEKYEPLSEEQIQELVKLVVLEEDDAVRAYGLYLDDVSLPQSARVTRLAPGEEDRTMSLHGERLRHDIDRKQWVITGLLQMLGLHRDSSDESGDQGEQMAKTPPSPRVDFPENEPEKLLKTKENAPKNEPKRT